MELGPNQHVDTSKVGLGLADRRCQPCMQLESTGTMLAGQPRQTAQLTFERELLCSAGEMPVQMVNEVVVRENWTETTAEHGWK